MTPADSGSSQGAKSILPLFILSCLLLAYVSLRAYLLPITYDEAYNYLEFTRKGVLSPFRFSALAANSHFLNTWLTYLTTSKLGVSELTLRLPVLAAYILFLYYTARLSSELSSPLLRISAFVVLNANPYVVDFFSLSRGYGLAFGLLAGSLWYLYRFFASHLQARYSLASLVCGILAVSAHLTLLHFLLSLVVVFIVTAILLAPARLRLPQRVLYSLKVNCVGVTGVACFLVPAFVVVRGLRNAEAFFWGGRASFWNDTIVSVFGGSLYDKPYAALLNSSLRIPSFGPSEALAVLAVLVALIALSVAIQPDAGRNGPGKFYLRALVVLLFSCLLASAVQHHLLHVPYLMRRTALYLLVVFGFLLVVLADEMARTRMAWQYWLPAMAVLVALHFLNCLNLRYVVDWKLDADLKEMISDIALARTTNDAHTGKFNTDAGVTLSLEAPLNYYRIVDNLSWLNVVDRRMTFHPLNDFYLYSDADWQSVEPDSFVVVKAYPLSASRLLRRRVRPSRYDIRLDKKLDFEGPADSITTLNRTSKEAASSGTQSGVTDEDKHRSGRIDYRIDGTSVSANGSMVTVKAMVWMKSLKNTSASLMVAFKRQNSTYFLRKLTVRDGAVRVRAWFPLYFTVAVPAEVRQGDVVSVYLSNENSLVYIDDLELRWITAVY
jgi:hypothetical protein